jgi:phage-related protein
MEPISQKILDFVNKIKDFFEPLWEPLRNLWDAIKGLGTAIWEALKPLFGELAESGILEFLRDLAILGIEFLTNAIIWLTDWINNNQKAFRGLVLIMAGVALGLLMILSPATAVIAIILGVIAVVLLLIKYWPVIKEKAIEAWEKIKETWGVVSTWFIEKIWTPLTTWAANTLNDIGKFFSNVWEFIKGVWNTVSNWFKTNVWQPIKDAAKAIWDAIVELITTGSWDGIKAIWKTASDWFITNVWDPLTSWAESVGISIVSFFTDAWEGIKSVFLQWANWINTNVIEPVVDFFTSAWDSVKEGFENAFNGITEFLKGVINGVIDLINGLINGIVTGMNAIIESLNGIQIKVPSITVGKKTYGGQTLGINLSTISAPQIPKLASGAVIPPNSQFLAVMGDQRSGRNLEAPEGLMRQIVREEMQGGQEVTINFAGSLGALVRELKPYIDKENVRIGRSMVRGT